MSCDWWIAAGNYIIQVLTLALVLGLALRISGRDDGRGP